MELGEIGPDYNALCHTTINKNVASKHKLCTVTGEEYIVTVPFDKFLLWRAGALAQDAFPDLTPDEREFMISGVTPAEWDEMQLDPDDADD